MSSLDTEDYFDIPEDRVRKSGEFKPLWTSAEAHLKPQNQEQVTFVATNSRFSQANPRDKIPSKLLKAMEQMDRVESSRVQADAQSEHSDFRENRNLEQKALDDWNPMLEDYESKVFNSYKEPSVTDFKNSFPGNSSQPSQVYTSFTLQSEQGDVRLFVGRIPPQMTREGLHNLFSQAGKVMTCKLVQQHYKDSNIGFVGFETVREAEAAIQKFDGFDLGKGDKLKVALALAKQKPTFGDLDETEPIVNGTARNGVPDSDDKVTSPRPNESSLQDDVLASTKSSVTFTGKPCSFCGQSGLKWCSACKIPYCSRECQKNDWPKHKLVCPRQSSAERKATNPETSQKTNAFLATAPGDTVQLTTHAQEQSDHPQIPLGDAVQPSEACMSTAARGDSDEETEPGSDKISEKDPVKVDGFDVENVEKFAQMIGFDLNQVQFVTKSKDSDESDNSDRSSSSSLDKTKSQEALQKVTVLPRERPSQQTLNNLATQPSSNSVALKPEGLSASQTCAKGHKRFFIKQLSMESVSESFFEAVVTEVENPSCLWAQMCTPEALERQDQLRKNLQALYCNSVYENYVPSAGEVCVAQFSFNSCWYRVKVDIVNNTGSLRVTYIDCGNHEDITVGKVRRITEDLASFPRQALKLSLHGITSSDTSGKWSSEATAFVKSKVLGIKCKVQVSGQHNEILFVKLFDPKETNSEETTINDSLMEAGFAKIKGRMPSSLSTSKQYNTSSQHECLQDISQGQHYGQKAVFDNSERRPFQQSNSWHSATNQVVKSPPYQSDQRQDSPKHSTEPSTRKTPFEAVINAIVNPWEFYAQKTDPQLLHKLNILMRDLNHNITTSPCIQQTKASLFPNQLCAAKFSEDSRWYRAVVLEKLPSGFTVRYVDFGNSEVVPESAVCPLAQQFQSFPPLSLQCSLAGVRKPKGQDWKPEAVQQFKSLVANKPFMFRIVHTHGIVNIVELLDPLQNREQTVANALISSGLADIFIHKDGTKHQLDGKRGPVFTGPQQQGAEGTQLLKSPFDETKKSHFSLQNSPNHNGGSLARDRIESAVFEPAVQAAALPQGAKPDVVVTEVVSPGLIYCQIASVELLTKNAKLTQDMNEHYNTVSYPPFVAHENDFCAAHFTRSGDWCRAYIKGTSAGSVHVHYVDFGNTEFVPMDRLRPLLKQFHFNALPFAALRCSLANIVPPVSTGWSDESMAFVKTLLPENYRGSVHVVGWRRGKLFVDITLKDTSESVSKALVKQGLAKMITKGDHRDQQNPQHSTMAPRNLSDKVVKEFRHNTPDIPNESPQREQSNIHDTYLLEPLVYQPAIQSALLPQDRSCFPVIVTEVTKSGMFYIQVGDLDEALKLKKLSEELNAFYRSSQPTSHLPQPKQLCAALYTESGDWCRAFIKEVTPERLVDVYYVDFGNTEKLPMSSIKPLEEKFSTAPFFALPCYLANIAQPESPGWSDQAMELINKNVSLECVNAKVLGKRSGMLFVDFIISKNPPQSLSQLLLNKGFAQRSTTGDTSMEHHGESSQPQEPLLPSSRQSTSSASSPILAGDLESRVLEPAIRSFAAADSFDAMITHVTSPSSLFVQVLRHDKVQMVEQLSVDLNAHYNAASYPPFQAQANQMCAGLFSGSGDWCRGFINCINPDDSVRVHYLDYGNSEVLSSSQLRPLEEHFQQLPPMALKCSLSGILPAHFNGWSTNAQEAILSQAPPDSRVHVQIIKKEKGLLFIDATTPESGQSLSQFLIRLGLASANLPDEGRYSGNQADQPVQSSPPVPTGESRVYSSAIPVVDVPLDNSFQVLISEVQRPDKIFFQVLSQENVHGLLALSEKLTSHCSSVNNGPYKPVQGELCCARFSKDQEWYRAVVEQEVSESKMMVVFVDYGNQDVVSVDSIRRITPSFTQLPIQGRECFLTGIQPTSGSTWSGDAVNFLKERLTPQAMPKPFFVKIDSAEEGGCLLGVQLFEADPSQQPGISINDDMIQRNLARNQDLTTTLQMTVPNVDQFDIVVTTVVHPGEIWAQVLDAEARHSLNVLMEQINQYCMAVSIPTPTLQPGQECCAQFSQDSTWYRARVLECLPSGQVGVQYVDFGNSELLKPDKIRPMKDDFFQLPAQALKLSLANIRPVHQVWNQEAVRWLEQILNRKLKARVVYRLPEHLVVSLTDGPVNISEELVRQGYAVKS